MSLGAVGSNLVDFAQPHNPETRVGWERSEGRADQAGVARAALYRIIAVAPRLPSRIDIVFSSAAPFINRT